MIYLIVLITLFVAGYWHYYQQKPITTSAKLLLFLLFWLFAGLSWETGVDWRIYSSLYKYSNSIPEAIDQWRFYGWEMSEDSPTEILYSAISSLAKTFSDEFVFLHCLLSLLSAVFFFKALSKYTTNIFFATMLYFGCIYITLNMSGVRQGLALSIVFYAYSYLADKKFWKYVLLILIASGVHMTAIILLPFYFILNRRISSNLIYILTTIGLVVYLFRISVMLKALSFVASLSDNALLSKLVLYIEMIGDDLFGAGEVSPKMLFYVAILLLVVYLRKQIVQENKSNNLLINLFTIYVILNLYFWDTGEIVMRFSFYFLVGLCVLLPSMVNSLKFRSNQNILIVLMLAIAFVSRMPVFVESPGALPYNPYQNYIWYQITGQPSTGNERLNNWAEDAE